MSYTRYSHPDMPSHVIADDADQSREDIIEDLLGGVDDGKLIAEPVNMTKEEYDALPEFEG
jgi:hypothetical protein